ncbi:MAG: hypothetical protein NTZ44_02225 [Candidatus Nomurabacteria bacterium]|nr:hypothetical protein [Candidatus Nomurabacteria bacterium]
MKEQSPEKNHKKESSFRKLKLAFGVALGLGVASETMAQITADTVKTPTETTIQFKENQQKIDTLESKTFNILDSQERQKIAYEIKAVGQALDSIHAQEDLVQYQENLMALSDKHLSPEEAQLLFNDVILKKMAVLDTNGIMVQGPTLSSEIARINRMLLTEIYKDKSPFSLEDNGDMIIPFKKTCDLTIPDLDGKIFFNHIFNSKYKYIFERNDVFDKNASGNITDGGFDIKNKDESVRISLSLRHGMVMSLLVFIKQGNKYYDVSYLEQKRIVSDDNGERIPFDKNDENQNIKTIQKVFDEVMK